LKKRKEKKRKEKKRKEKKKKRSHMPLPSVLPVGAWSCSGCSLLVCSCAGISRSLREEGCGSAVVLGPCGSGD
jgi:hypothetical protein